MRFRTLAVQKHTKASSSTEYRDIGSSNLPDSVRVDKGSRQVAAVPRSGRSTLRHRRGPRPGKRFGLLRKWLARGALIYLSYATLWQCPSHVDKKGVLAPDSPYICSGINEVKSDFQWVFNHPVYKQHVGQHIDPYWKQANEHYDTYAGPVISKSKHYGEKYGIPAAQKAHGAYQQYMRPVYAKANDHAKQQYDRHAKAHVDRYYSEAEQQYKKHIAPHVDYATKSAQQVHSSVRKFHSEKVVSFNKQAGARIEQGYNAVKPHVERAVQQSVHVYQNNLKPAAIKASKHSADYYERTFKPTALAIIDTIWRLIQEYAYKFKVWSVDVANKGYVHGQEVYTKHAKPYYDQNIAPVVSEKYKAYLEPTVNDAKKFIVTHVDVDRVQRGWDTVKQHSGTAYRYTEEQALLGAAIAAEFVKQQHQKFLESRHRASEAAKAAKQDAYLSASSVVKQASKAVSEQESSVIAAGVQATQAAADMKDKAKGAVHGFASEALQFARQAQTKVFDAAENVRAQASKGSDAAFSQFEKAKHAVADGVHHGVDEVSNLVNQATGKVKSAEESVASQATSLASTVKEKASSAAKKPNSIASSITSVATSIAATTPIDVSLTTSSATYATATTVPSDGLFEKVQDQVVITGEGLGVSRNNDAAQTIAAQFREATEPEKDNISTSAKASPAEQASSKAPETEPMVPIVVPEASMILKPEPVTPIGSESEANDSESLTETEGPAEAPVNDLPELQPKGADDLTPVPPNDVGDRADGSEFKQAPIRYEEKSYLNNIVSVQIEEIITAADIIRTQLEEKYDEIERVQLENLQRVSDTSEEETDSQVSQLVQSFRDYYESQAAESTVSHEDKLKSMEEKYQQTLNSVSDVLLNQRSDSSKFSKQAKSEMSAAQKDAEAQIRQKFKEGMHRLRSGEKDVTGLNERQHRELQTKLEDAQVQALKLVHSAEKAIEVEQKLLKARTNRILSKLDRREKNIKEQLEHWLEQAHHVLSIADPLVDLQASAVEADLEGFEIEHQPVPQETSLAEPHDDVTPVEPVAEQVQKELHHRQLVDEHIRKAQEKAARVAKTVEDWVEAAKRKSARTSAASSFEE
ncbi:hypothetical protein INT43_001640 [Umbelopsis isabellina]|uniref:Uncharacterized protein n=1 Tax=Mortierella isabellina TaxID=91625 RepID=A0A8H7UGX5_MORIS|nr:hypothetical protein INT43_001640 [Umbelopsis isabellina]